MNWKIVNSDMRLNKEFKVGTLLKDSNDNILIVGDVNTVLGVCDDCRYIDLIVAYSEDFVEEINKLKKEEK